MRRYRDSLTARDQIMTKEECIQLRWKTNDDGTKIQVGIHLSCRGGVMSLQEIADAIIANEKNCIDDFLNTIHCTIAAYKRRNTVDLKRLHIRAVKSLQYKCYLLDEMLYQQVFNRKEEVSEAFNTLNIHTGTLASQLN